MTDSDSSRRKRKGKEKQGRTRRDGKGRGWRRLDRVNIYTHTDIRGLKPRDGKAWYILETETSKGPATAGDKLQLEQTTENQAELTALLTAVRRVKIGCELHIYTDSAFAAAGWTMDWISGWKKNDWKNRKGDPVAFREMWQELDQIINGHHTEFHVKEYHEYSAWFRIEAERERKESYVREIRRIQLSGRNQ